jgi:hypothetical protein
LALLREQAFGAGGAGDLVPFVGGQAGGAR